MLASNSDAMREWARNVGKECLDSAWLLHDWDVWVQNPWYQGEIPPHPESDYDSESLDSEYDIYVAQAESLGWVVKSYDEWLNS